MPSRSVEGAAAGSIDLGFLPQLASRTAGPRAVLGLGGLAVKAPFKIMARAICMTLRLSTFHSSNCRDYGPGHMHDTQTVDLSFV